MGKKKSEKKKRKEKKYVQEKKFIKLKDSVLNKEQRHQTLFFLAKYSNG